LTYRFSYYNLLPTTFKGHKMPPKRTKEEIQTIVNDYVINKLSFKDIHTKHGACHRAVRRWIEDAGYEIKIHTHISKDVLQAATNDHINGMLMKNVESKYNISHFTIYKYMKDNDISYSNEHGRRHFVNKSYFEDIDTERKAYWLGFIMADGCVTRVTKTDKSPSRLIIQISAKDKHHLEIFNADIGSTYRIEEYIPKGTYSTNPMCSLVINSVEFVHNLTTHGICERKTGTEHIPSSIPEDLIRHFIRGFLDGDGSISDKRVSFSCPLDMCNDLIKAINLKDYTIREEKRISADIVYLSYRKKHCAFFSTYLYKNSTVHLERKSIKLLS
jgi:DNA-binding transcriptional regulator WhiA